MTFAPAEGRADWIEIAGTFCFYALAAFAAAGVLLLRRRGTAVWNVLIAVVLVVLVSVLGYGVPRFRHPADLALLALAAVALDARLKRQPRVDGAAGADSAGASPRTDSGMRPTSRFSRSAGRSTT